MRYRAWIIAGAGAALLVAGCGTSQSTNDSSAASSSASGEPNQHVFEADHFAAGAIVGEVVNEECTLSGGTQTTCARVTVSGYPSSYSVGPFCPKTITTPARDAGIWFDGSGVYDLDGPFIRNLAEFYKDSQWKLYDDKGNVTITDTQEKFEGAARPDVQPEYQNQCVEGQLAWLPDGKPIEATMLIPVAPIKATAPSSGNHGDFGITLDGVVIAPSAPVDKILGAHTIASFDDCGGHYNPVAGYHLHGVTGCGHLEGDVADGETRMFGYAADGYPINLPLEGDAVAAADLDACNGHVSASEGYHYHANSAAKNAVLPCLMGEYVATAGAAGGPAGGPPGGGQDGAGPAAGGIDLPAVAAVLGVTEHELADALEAEDLTAVAEMLGTTPATMAEKLGMSVADLQSALMRQQNGG